MNMMRLTRNLAVVGLMVVLGSACSSQAPAPQILTGKVAVAGFPATVNAVRVTQAGTALVEAPLAADGSFAVTIPAGKAYRMEFVHAAGQAGLVAPRQSGVIGATFDVRGGRAPFDLGMVRYIGDPRAQSYTYRSTPAADATDGDNVQCEDGIDPTTGAVCVDDNSQDGEVCQAADGDNVECEDGIDPNTGAPCDGGPAANATDNSGTESDGVADSDNVECEDGIDPTTGAACPNDDAEDVPDEAAVADHNLPDALGCGGQEEGGAEGGGAED